MFSLFRIQYIVEIVLAELIFLFAADRRKLFWLKYPVGIAICALIAGFYPFFDANSQLSQFIMFMLLFFLTVLVSWLSFDISIPDVISSCTAGYAVQHIVYHLDRIFSQYVPYMSATDSMALRFLLGLIPYIVCYVLFFITLVLYCARHEIYRKADLRFNTVSMAIVLICIGLSRVSGYFRDWSITVSCYAIVACTMALVIQLVLSRVADLQREKDTISLLWQEDLRQYEISKKTIDTINIKYHDLKHKLRDLNLPPEEVDAIKDAVRVYGSRFKTGNEALDVLLTENSLRLKEEGITLTYTGNGDDLSFMNTMDVYSLFGNAIENAVEAVRKVEEPEKKVIDIVSEKHGCMVNIHVSNFFTGQVEIENGLPVTTKKEEQGFHGFGMKSMRLVAEKYGGNLNCVADGDVFDLSVYLMREANA